MDFSQIIQRQIEADKRRGFAVSFASDAERLDQLIRDAVGLMGEVGEFANMLKKVDLARTVKAYVGPSLSEASANLREELADAVIYIMRLTTILGGDLQQDVLTKMDQNDKRYRDLEQ